MCGAIRFKIGERVKKLVDDLPATRSLRVRCVHASVRRHKMDFDIDGASQSTVSAPSLSWWMMKNLWQQGVPDERHLRLSIADTFLLEDGHLMYWYFTSANSGLVLKVGGPRRSAGVPRVTCSRGSGCCIRFSCAWSSYLYGRLRCDVCCPKIQSSTGRA